MLYLNSPPSNVMSIYTKEMGVSSISTYIIYLTCKLSRQLSSVFHSKVENILRKTKIKFLLRSHWMSYWVAPWLFWVWSCRLCVVSAAAATETPTDGDTSRRRKRSKTDDVYQLLRVVPPPLQCVHDASTLVYTCVRAHAGALACF